MVYSTIRKHEIAPLLRFWLRTTHYFSKRVRKRNIYGCLLELKVYFSGSELLYSTVNWGKQAWI